MDKFWIVLRREFLERVQNKLFLITTLAMPLLLVALMIIPVLVAKFAGNEAYEIQVIDRSGKILPELLKIDEADMTFKAALTDEEAVKKSFADKKGMALMIIGDDLSRAAVNVQFQAPQTPSTGFSNRLQRKLEKIFAREKLLMAGLSSDAARNAEVKVRVLTKKITRDGKEETTSPLLGFVFGYGMGLLSFMMVFIYGGILMKGVMEEKTNRIVEVIISSVRPIHLMFGKIIGIGLVGLLQFAIWGVLIVILTFMVLPLLGAGGAEEMAGAAGGMDVETAKQASGIHPEDIMNAVQQFKISSLVFFIFYFLGGYLLYGCLFAAIGASIDTEADAGPLTTIISIPAYIPILMLPAITNNPDGNLAFWLSIIPFTSPPIMVARMAMVDVPYWQVALSLGLLVGGIYGSIWVAARIYRVGLLMYGKKVTFKELYKWLLIR